MPNWCFNHLVVSEDTPAFSEWLSKGGFSFERILETPPELLNGDGWYNWRIDNWGTKWDVDPKKVNTQEFNGQISLDFDTAWAPPLQVIEKLSEMFPTAYFQLTYFEPGMCFAGKFTAKDGRTHDNSDESGGLLYSEIAESFGCGEEN